MVEVEVSERFNLGEREDVGVCVCRWRCTVCVSKERTEVEPDSLELGHPWDVLFLDPPSSGRLKVGCRLKLGIYGFFAYRRRQWSRESDCNRHGPWSPVMFRSRCDVDLVVKVWMDNQQLRFSTVMDKSNIHTYCTYYRDHLDHYTIIS